MRKHLVNALTGIIIGGFFLYLTLKNKPLDEIFALLIQANTGWILLALFFLVLMFFFRAYRWKLLLENNGHNPGIRNVSYSLLLGFFINSFTPKLGEVIRCTSLKKSEDIPVSKSFGTVITERIYDLLTLLLAIVIILFLEFDRLKDLIVSALESIGEAFSSNILTLIIILLSVAVLGLILFFVFRRYDVMKRIKSFFNDFWSTVKRTFRIKASRIFTIQTLIIWMLMLLMNYACLRALPSTQNLSLYFAFVVLFIGTIGWAIPSPGGIGTTHFFVLQLFLLFNMSEEAGVTYGILVNGITVLFTIFGGLLALIIVNSLRLVRSKRVEGLRG
ncbi:MAG TPA: lysylphosphatidylglycerol synthase transmembrane domain-containing protein [Bacteroidales bacterium]|nr:lysylphosphatidylglycerol synthase transmembrane domain-containing protein [Bacteroidales bacterium]